MFPYTIDKLDQASGFLFTLFNVHKVACFVSSAHFKFVMSLYSSHVKFNLHFNKAAFSASHAELPSTAFVPVSMHDSYVEFLSNRPQSRIFSQLAFVRSIALSSSLQPNDVKTTKQPKTKASFFIVTHSLLSVQLVFDKNILSNPRFP